MACRRPVEKALSELAMTIFPEVHMPQQGQGLLRNFHVKIHVS